MISNIFSANSKTQKLEKICGYFWLPRGSPMLGGPFRGLRDRILKIAKDNKKNTHEEYLSQI